MRRLILYVVFVMSLVGCGSYYKVTDPATRNVYYTTDIDKMKSGSIKFKDAKSGSEVVLPSSEVIEIDKKEFKKVTGKE